MSVPARVPHYCHAYPCPNTVTDGAYCAEHARPARQHQRRHYNTTPGVNYGRKWGKARLRFLASHPYCVDCQAVMDLEVDHEIPHEGNAELFWDESNWRTRCKTCHSKKTARETWNRGEPQVSRGARYVITGAPGTGKSTWVQQRARPGDIVFDLDAIAVPVTQIPSFPRPPEAMKALLAMRDGLVAWLEQATIAAQVFLIVANRGEAEAVAEAISATVIEPNYRGGSVG